MSNTSLLLCNKDSKGEAAVPGHTYLLEQTQDIARPGDEVFAFFSDAQHLDTLTPDFLHFRILTPLPIVLQAGTLIDYSLQLFRVPFRWRTRIEVFEPPSRFIDTQIRGPYRLWRHLHTFQSIPGGTRVYDRVEYALPLGPFGRLTQRLLVRDLLEDIFTYRRQRLAAFFAAPS